MSFILKALKKLEKEKAARQAGRVEINSAIMAPAKNTATSSRRIPFWLTIFLVIAAVAGTLLFARHRAPAPVAEPKANPAASVAKVPQPEIASPPDATEKISDSPATTVKNAEPSVSDRENVKPSLPTPEAQPQPKQMDRQRTAVEPVTTRSVESPHNDEPPPLIAPPASLTVNGIALQDDPGRSIAVVNGSIVKRGMSVNGARVERIFLDRVRFSGNNGVFEVHLSR